MATSVASAVFFSAHPEQLIELFHALDIPLQREDHGDGVVHWACELGDVHLAVFRADDVGQAPDLQASGSTFFGVYVDDLDTTIDRLAELGADITTPHQQRPWGCRIIVKALDGRSIEVNQRHHCV